MNYNSILFFITASFFSSFLTACSIPHTIKTSDIQTFQTGTPLQRVSPKTFLLSNFNDIRGKDPYYFHSNPAHIWKLDKSVTDVVTSAFKIELERNGHKCVLDKKQQSIDYTIDGTVYKYSSIDYVGFFTSKRVVDIAAKVTITNQANPKNVFIKSYEGHSEYESGLPGGPQYIDMISEAQTEMIKAFSTDLELVSFIENKSSSAPQFFSNASRSNLTPSLSD
jgi:hypothetical protein